MFDCDKYRSCILVLLSCFNADSNGHRGRRQDLNLCLMGLERIEENYRRLVIDASTADEEARMLLSRWI